MHDRDGLIKSHCKYLSCPCHIDSTKNKTLGFRFSSIPTSAIVEKSKEIAREWGMEPVSQGKESSDGMALFGGISRENGEEMANVSHEKHSASFTVKTLAEFREKYPAKEDKWNQIWLLCQSKKEVEQWLTSKLEEALTYENIMNDHRRGMNALKNGAKQERERLISLIEKNRISHMDDAEYPHDDCTAVTRHNAIIDQILGEINQKP